MNKRRAGLFSVDFPYLFVRVSVCFYLDVGEFGRVWVAVSSLFFLR